MKIWNKFNEVMPTVLNRNSEDWHVKLFQNVLKIKNYEHENFPCLPLSKEKFSKKRFYPFK